MININLFYFIKLASLSEESCLSIFPRARPTFHDKIEEVEVTREEEGEQTTQTVPEIQPLKRVKYIFLYNQNSNIIYY